MTPGELRRPAQWTEIHTFTRTASLLSPPVSAFDDQGRRSVQSGGVPVEQVDLWSAAPGAAVPIRPSRPVPRVHGLDDPGSSASATARIPATAPTPPSGAPVRPGFAHGLLLLVGSSVPVLGGVLAAPLLPAIAQEFAGTPGVEVMVPLVVGSAGLAVALTAPFAGALVDRLGRNRLLSAALVLFAAAGTAPAYLLTLPAILASRVALGLAEAVVVVVCTTLIGDYFPGEKRDRWLGWQVVATSLSATAFFVLGGALGEAGWRVPFWVYAVTLLLAPVMARLPVVAPDPGERRRGRVSWRLLVLPCGLTLLTSTLFYVVPTQLSLLLAEQGMRSTQAIGVITGAAALATGLGAFLIGYLDARRPWLLLPVECAVTAAGLVVLGGSGTSTALAAVGAMLSSAGGGMLVATLLIWTMRLLDIGVRGLGTGAWAAMFFLGQFAGPVLVSVIGRGEPGGLQRAITVLGFGGAALVVLTAVLAALPAVRRAGELSPA